MISFGYGPIGFCQTVDMHRNKIEVRHLLEEVGRGRGGRNGDADGRREFCCILRGTEECVDCWCCVEVCDVLCFKHIPD